MKGESLVNNGQNVSISNEYDQEKCTEEEVNATDVPAKSIKAIDKTTVHRICSGQVVLTLATAVKELVENSIDAGATSVEIRLKDYGSCSIEVSDNGKGVEPRDFEGLALKHHTSKLNDFGDLVGVKTFGFRGEALSSLCALSDLTVVTRHSSQTIGTKLAFNSNGKLVEETPVSRQVGTTVTLQNLFHTLPVRHKEFLRNLKKEFGKMVQVLYSYCLISTTVRILCSNQCGKNGKTTVVSTESQSSLKENISSIFGPKQVASLLEIKQKPPDDKILSEYGISGCGPNGSSAHFQLEGFVSSCVHGKGRSAADRQFYFINNRPCDPAKVVRVVNEVYHHYNRHQFPAVVLNIGMKVEDVDVNVTPDKRQIMVNRERLLLATVKTTLICLYEDLPSVLELQNTPVRRALEARGTSSLFQSPPSTTTPTSRLLAASSLSQRFSHSAAPSASPTLGGVDNKAKKSTVFAAATFGGIKRAFAAHSDFQSAAKQPRLHDFCFKINGGSSSPVVRSGTGDVEAEILDDSRPTLVGEEPSEALSEVTKDDLSLSPRSVTSGVECSLPSEPITPNKFPPQVLEQELQSRNRSPPTPDDEEPRTQNGVVATVPSSEDLLPRSPPLTKTPTSRAIHSKTDAFLNSLKSAKKRNTTMALYPSENSATNEESTLSPADDDDVVIIDDTPGEDPPTIGARKTSSSSPPDVIIYDDVVGITIATSSVRGKCVVVPLSLDCLRHKLASSRVSSRRRKAEEDGDLCRKFRAKIAPSENASAEDELKKQLTKEEFRQMTVIGQFNLGFIVTRLGEDLFVVDQHATDEKYHFESLQKTCVLQSQKLIVPHTLELTAANEGVLLDNLHVFSRNGFEFEVDPQREAGRRVALTKMPHSRGWEFSRQDVEEMIFMLSDAPGVMCRPSRVNAMFASRACRKAVMIGTFLSRSHMRSLIDHMADMEQPWNCPHGRPTLRHLINLDMLAKLEQGE